MALIGISGKISSGKNTVASIIQYLTSDDCSKQCLPRLKHGLDIQGFHNSHWKQVAFAGKLKQIVSILTGIPIEDLEKQEVKDRVLGKEWNRKIGGIFEPNNVGSLTEVFKIEKMTVRQLLQEIGTDAMRDVIHPNVWVNALFADYTPNMVGEYTPKYPEYPSWIITDLRFSNELQAVKDRGGVTIRVNRPGLVENNHLSETSLDSATFDFIIDNDKDIEHLIDEVRDIVKDL